MNTGVRPHNLLVITACVVFVTLISLNVSAQDRFSIENSADWDNTIIDGSTSLPSENSSAFAGDRIQLSIEVSNNDTTACLLYTSPSPRDATLSRMPSSA